MNAEPTAMVFLKPLFKHFDAIFLFQTSQGVDEIFFA